MKVTASTKIKTLIRSHPAVEEILGWFDVEVTPAEQSMTLERLCREYDLDLDDVITDIEVAIGEEESDGHSSLFGEGEASGSSSEASQEASASDFGGDDDEEDEEDDKFDDDEFNDDFDGDDGDEDDDENFDEDEDAEDAEAEGGEPDWN